MTVTSASTGADAAGSGAVPAQIGLAGRGEKRLPAPRQSAT